MSRRRLRCACSLALRSGQQEKCSCPGGWVVRGVLWTIAGAALHLQQARQEQDVMQTKISSLQEENARLQVGGRMNSPGQKGLIAVCALPSHSLQPQGRRS